MYLKDDTIQTSFSGKAILIEIIEMVTRKHYWMLLSSVVTLCMISRAIRNHRSFMSMLLVLSLLKT